MKRHFFYLLFFFISCLANAQESFRKIPKVGLVLSGGGAKGFAHIGVLKAIEKSGLQLDYIGGTSMGAVVGGLYAANYSAIEIDSIIKSIDFNELLQDKVPRNSASFFEKQHGEKYLMSFPVKNKKIQLPKAIATGQSSYNKMNELFEHVNDIHDYDQLPIPFFCIATDLETGKTKVFDKGQLAESIRASASLPSLLSPISVEGNYYIDGGIANNFPVEIMEDKGVTIIIGSDIQGKLGKSEEIESVVDVLNQIVSFQMYTGDYKKTERLDIHIKPDIATYSVTSFDKTQEIIDLGEEAGAKHQKIFDELASLQNITKHKSSLVVPKSPQKISVDSIQVNKLPDYTKKYILGKMGLNVLDTITYSELNTKIDKLTNSNDFELVKYRFEKMNSNQNLLVLNMEENQVHSFLKLGLHYDPLYKSGFLVNFTSKHLLQKDDIFSTDVVFGDNVRLDVNYFVDKGFYLSYGFNARFNEFNTNIRFSGTDVNSINKYFIDFTSMAYFQTTFNRIFAIGGGIEFKRLELYTNALVQNNGERFYFERSSYASLLGYIKLDSYDKKFFPTFGYFVDGEIKFYGDSSDYNDNFTPFSQLKLKLSGVNTIYDRLTIHLTAEGGATIGSNTSGQFRYALGGYGENLINNHIPFYGYEFEYFQNHSYLKGTAEFRYDIGNNHNIGVIGNVGRTDLDVFNGGAVFKDLITGYAVAYGYKSVVGPISLVRCWSPEIKSGNWYLSVGLWF
ncbi:MAG: patatin-like phospholipase family protein [Flavicella sp.]